MPCKLPCLKSPRVNLERFDNGQDFALAVLVPGRIFETVAEALPGIVGQQPGRLREEVGGSFVQHPMVGIQCEPGHVFFAHRRVARVLRGANDGPALRADHGQIIAEATMKNVSVGLELAKAIGIPVDGIAYPVASLRPGLPGDAARLIDRCRLLRLG